MFGMDIRVLGIIVLAAVAAGAIAYMLFFGQIETEKKTERRLNKVRAAETDTIKMKAARDRVAEASKRRKSVQDSLKELERKQQEKSRKQNIGLKERIQQAGLKITVSQFYIYSAAFGLFAFVLAFLGGFSPLIALSAAFALGAGLPQIIVRFLVNRRKKQFLAEFPNALDVMVRSIKSGLPLNDALRLIAVDGQEPVKTEIRRVVEAQQMGFNIPEACARMYQSIPLQEVSFFAVVIAIQSQAGGNLSEALGNLSRVLRDRKKMRAKVSALSMEAKASAGIIGILPFAVAFMVYLTSPEYIMTLFTDPRGHLILGFSAIWMSIGILVMKKMVSFDI
ncbi:type II secretion system F family protein [Rhizobium sp. L1K21]|uniref:type II secretion system F family protein n=1 Tax=Rhizobium sp. L1K21 TaxID=2954933 RepID=UPI0020923BEE|nr:type II secretion system F family protein [Rhizobium sp. L1K21]MCO6187263.1 type II secretion system F family protein [Rhizobium sp. L1K21]